MAGERSIISATERLLAPFLSSPPNINRLLGYRAVERLLDPLAAKFDAFGFALRKRLFGASRNELSLNLGSQPKDGGGDRRLH